MSNQEKHAWAFPTATGLALSLGLQGLREGGAEDLVPVALKSFMDSIARKVGTAAGSEFAAKVSASKGDLTKVEGYQELHTSIASLAAIEAAAGAGSLGPALVTVRRAEALLIANKSSFQKAYSGVATTGRYTYLAAAIALFGSVSLLIAHALEFQEGARGLEVKVSTPGAARVASSLPVSRLERFVQRAERANFDKALNEHADVIESEALSEFTISPGVMVATGAAAVVFLAMFARDIVEWYFVRRREFARWLELQATFLELNTLRLKGANSEAIRQRQAGYAAQFRSAADYVRVTDASLVPDTDRAIREQDSQIAMAGGSGPSVAGSLV